MNDKRMIAIEKIAENVRNDCQITDYGIQNIFECTKKLGYRLIRYPFVIDSFSGLAMIKEGERIVISNTSQILAREIFTIAHEIGHQKLHIEENVIDLIKDDISTEKNTQEIEADYFAACYLMPSEKVNNYIRLELEDKPIETWNGLEIAKIQTTFNASYDTVLNRLEALKVIDDNIKTQLYNDKIKHTVTKLLSIIDGNIDLCKKSEVKKIPSEFIEWVISNYNDKLIPFNSLEYALKIIDLKPEDFQIVDESEFEDEEDF